MAIKFQFNKTSLGDLDKQLKMRTKALPTIKSKESALRVEVKSAKDMVVWFDREIERLSGSYHYMMPLWSEFDPSLLSIKDVNITETKIAGVRVPASGEVIFEQKDYDLFGSPLWIADGISILKEFASLNIEREIYVRKMELLDWARKKTTQKVNLYEKVQIPGYEDAIRKIKRFLEDEENLSKSAQKIVKTRQEAATDGML